MFEAISLVFPTSGLFLSAMAWRSSATGGATGPSSTKRSRPGEGQAAPERDYTMAAAAAPESSGGRGGKSKGKGKYNRKKSG